MHAMHAARDGLLHQQVLAWRTAECPYVIDQRHMHLAMHGGKGHRNAELRSGKTSLKREYMVSEMKATQMPRSSSYRIFNNTVPCPATSGHLKRESESVAYPLRLFD